MLDAFVADTGVCRAAYESSRVGLAKSFQAHASTALAYCAAAFCPPTAVQNIAAVLIYHGLFVPASS